MWKRRSPNYFFLVKFSLESAYFYPFFFWRPEMSYLSSFWKRRKSLRTKIGWWQLSSRSIRACQIQIDVTAERILWLLSLIASSLCSSLFMCCPVSFIAQHESKAFARAVNCTIEMGGYGMKINKKSTNCKINRQTELQLRSQTRQKTWILIWFWGNSVSDRILHEYSSLVSVI